LQKIAVLTSGGDASGMNAAIRAVVRSAIYLKMQVYGVYQGFEGLIAGNLKEMTLGSVADIIHRGGTILQTSRSNLFMEEKGIEKAKKNLDELGIENLVVIGFVWIGIGYHLFSGRPYLRHQKVSIFILHIISHSMHPGKIVRQKIVHI
jgi:hypothetical protein